MRKILMIAVVISSFLLACKKENNTSPAVDARDKFVGTWKGTINIVYPTLPTLPTLPPLPGGSTLPDFSTLPTSIPVTYAIAKNQSVSNELQITVTVDEALRSFVSFANPLAATSSESGYTYKEFNLTVQALTVKCNGTGTINADGRSITEAGNWNYLSTISSTWSSSLTKQP